MNASSKFVEITVYIFFNFCRKAIKVVSGYKDSSKTLIAWH